jgi:Family of unknown function (DUF6529)
MSDYLVKTLIALALLGAGLTSFLTMMAVMGKAGERANAAKLRRLHKWSGFAFLALLVPLVYFGAEFLSDIGEGLSVRAVFHVVLAVLLLALVLLKFLIVRTYRQFLKYAPGLGMTVFALTAVIFLITAGYFLLRGGVLE